MFAFLKLSATLFSLGGGGVSAMFVPLFPAGGALGNVFAGSIVHTGAFDVVCSSSYGSVYCGRLQDAAGSGHVRRRDDRGHFYIIPSLIGAARAYAISGESPASRDQRLHEAVKFSGITGVPVREVMQRRVVSVQADTTLRSFADSDRSPPSARRLPSFGERPPDGYCRCLEA